MSQEPAKKPANTQNNTNTPKNSTEDTRNTPPHEIALQRARAELLSVVKEPPRGLYVLPDGSLHTRTASNPTFDPPRISLKPVHTATHPQPHNSSRILTYINEGLSWPRPHYTNSADFDQGGFEWCGAFVAFAYKHLKQEIRAKHMASTYRLHAFCKNTPRAVPLSKIQPGDVLVVGSSHSKPWGAHITLVHSVDTARSLAHTYEGNATGTLGDGSRGEGVVSHSRPLAPTQDPKQYHAMHAYRWLPSDYSA